MSDTARKIAAGLGTIKSDTVLKNAKVVDVFCHRIIEADVAICEGKIVGIGEYKGKEEVDLNGAYVMPSFFDTHIHFESSLLTPSEYIKLAVTKGVTMVNADCHEIANVCGEDGIAFMIESAKDLPMDVNFMLPSCVPATPFDHGNAVLSAAKLLELKEKYNFFGLAEMMNYPGLLALDDDVMKKLDLFGIIDGHAPSLKGNALSAYRAANVLTDHESATTEEVLEKISKGMYVMIREGSQTKNLVSLIKCADRYVSRRMIFCTDDRYCGELKTSGSISNCINLAIKCGLDPIDAISMATLNAYECYRIPDKGAIAPGYDADIVVSRDLNAQEITRVYRGGKLIAEGGKATFTNERNVDLTKVTNTVNIKPVTEADFDFTFDKNTPVIGVMPDTVVTKKLYLDSAEGLDRLAVIERHKATGNIGKCFVSGFNLKGGAIAQTVGHDAHNITVIGDNARDMALAVNALGKGGGMVLVVKGKVEAILPLPVAGLMSDKDADTVMREHDVLLEKTKALGINKKLEPFMLVSFLSLIVIPELKLTDSGLFDVTKFEFIK